METTVEVNVDLTKRDPTRTYASELQRAFDFFNEKLFGNRLPRALITYTKRKNVFGHFGAVRWQDTEENFADEIALNPEKFRSRPVEEVLSTLVHEMTHQEQFHFGKPSRNGYHNKAWGVLMRRVGLIPSSTGEPGGKETGQKVSHYIDEGGPFDLAVRELVSEGYKLTWASPPPPLAAQSKSGYVPYLCMGCGARVRGKRGLFIGCRECNMEMDQLGD